MRVDTLLSLLLLVHGWMSWASTQLTPVDDGGGGQDMVYLLTSAVNPEVARRVATPIYIVHRSTPAWYPNPPSALPPHHCHMTNSITRLLPTTTSTPSTTHMYV